MSVIKIDSLSFSYEKKMPVIGGISFSINEGERWAIIGKNGCGKSTLLKCIGSLLPVAQGTVVIKDRPADSYNPHELAKLIAYVPQAIGRVQPPYSVVDFVMLGRFPYQGFFALPLAEDRKIVREVLQLTDTEKLADRSMTTLSGGELQRVFLAAAVAQKSGILLLDEPMSFLDPLHQSMMQRSLDRIHDEFNTTIITVTHDVNLAVNRYTHICAITETGNLYFAGTTQKFGEKALKYLQDIYSIKFLEINSYNDDTRYYTPESVS
jgi:iron complex transport system ATP-binding protein